MTAVSHVSLASISLAALAVGLLAAPLAAQSQQQNQQPLPRSRIRTSGRRSRPSRSAIRRWRSASRRCWGPCRSRTRSAS
ncbi:hypothetical protein ACFSLT_02650 [Novosphingobium resinovorum]